MIGLYTGENEFHEFAALTGKGLTVTEFLSKSLAEESYPGKRFSLVEPVTEMRSDSHRGENYILKKKSVYSSCWSCLPENPIMSF